MGIHCWVGRALPACLWVTLGTSELESKHRPQAWCAAAAGHPGMPWTQLLSPAVKNKGCSKILSDLIMVFPQGEEEAARSCSLELCSSAAEITGEGVHRDLISGVFSTVGFFLQANLVLFWAEQSLFEMPSQSFSPTNFYLSPPS